MAKKQVEYKDQIKQGKLEKIPSWIKVFLLKYWVAGAAFYFFGMGGAFIWNRNPDDFDLSTIRLCAFLGLGLAIMMEYIAKPIIRLMRTSIDDTYRYNLINLRGMKSFFLNLLYGMVLSTLAMAIAVFLMRLGVNFDPLKVTEYGGVEPFSMGLIYLLLDIISVLIKNASISTYKRIRTKVELKRQQALLDEDDVPVYGEIKEVETDNNDHFLND